MTIISPILFNLALTKLIHIVSAVGAVHATAYVDDVTIWTQAADHPSTEVALYHLEKALDTFTTHLAATGMEISVAKTKFLAIRGTPGRERVHLTMAGEPLQAAPEGWVRILGLPIYENGGATEWIRYLRLEWRSLLNLIHRISHSSGGASQAMLSVGAFSKLVEVLPVTPPSAG